MFIAREALPLRRRSEERNVTRPVLLELKFRFSERRLVVVVFRSINIALLRSEEFC
jgi:hypothetical protein